MAILSIEYKDDGVRDLLQKLSDRSKEASEVKLIVGTNVSYAAEHQLGDGQIKREFLGVSDSDRSVIIEMLEEALRDSDREYREALREVGEYMLLSTDQRWEQEVAPDGTPWPKNALWVSERKKRLGRINKILQDTGRLRSSINYRIE